MAILDADDLWLPNKLEKMLPLFDDPEVGLVYSNSQYFSDSGDLDRCFDHHRRPHRGEIFGPLLLQNFISSETMMFRKSHLSRLSYLFNPNYTVICDYDLTVRLALVTKADYCREVLSKWRVHNISVTSKRPYLGAHETKRMIKELVISLGPQTRFYEVHLRAMHKFADYQLAREAFLEGKRMKAVSILSGHLLHHPKWIFTAGVYALFPLPMFEFWIARRQKSS